MHCTNGRGMATLLQQKNCMKTLTNGGVSGGGTNSSTNTTASAASAAATLQQARVLLPHEMVSLPASSMIQTSSGGNSAPATAIGVFGVAGTTIAAATSNSASIGSTSTQHHLLHNNHHNSLGIQQQQIQNFSHNQFNLNNLHQFSNFTTQYTNVVGSNMICLQTTSLNSNNINNSNRLVTTTQTITNNNNSNSTSSHILGTNTSINLINTTSSPSTMSGLTTATNHPHLNTQQQQHPIDNNSKQAPPITSSSLLPSTTAAAASTLQYHQQQRNNSFHQQTTNALRNPINNPTPKNHLNLSNVNSSVHQSDTNSNHHHQQQQIHHNDHQYHNRMNGGEQSTSSAAGIDAAAASAAAAAAIATTSAQAAAGLATTSTATASTASSAVAAGAADEDQEPEPEIDIVINNVVCSFSVRCHLNLREIALNGFNVEFRRENGMVTMKLRRPYTTASIWSSGRITCTGATSEDQAKIAARRYARCLQKLGFSVRFHNFRVVNVLGTCSMPWAIKIVNFSERYKKEASYEPELHPGVTYKLKYPKATLKIFSTGSITVTAGSVAHVQAAIEHIFPLVYEFRKKRSAEDMELLRSKNAALVSQEKPTVDNEEIHSPSAKRKRPLGCADNDPSDDIMYVSEHEDYEIDDAD